jgi:hypothetical protein
MRNIRVSEEVWQSIAAQGKFGETEDDVLRRIFKLPAISAYQGAKTPAGEFVEQRPGNVTYSPRRTRAQKRMSSFIDANQLHVSFQDGTSRSWTLPSSIDKLAIRTVRDNAVAFARENGATIGQVNAVKKALTDSGYHLIK